MAKARKAASKSRRTGKAPKKRPVESYDHRDKKRANNPPVGLVTPDTDPDQGRKKTYQYDPHLDPQLVWAGKAEHTSFEVPTVSLHVHERIDPRTIIAAVRRNGGSGQWSGASGARGTGVGTDPSKGAAGAQLPLFEQPAENPPLREAIEFYKHAHNWTNRLIAGDSLLVMNSLLQKEGMAGKVQMVYIDPPYGIRYGSNFQPFVNKRDVKDGNDDDLTQEPEMIRAFRDTWELGIHSYLTYLRDRLLLARELLHESGSCFVQISDENLHHVRELMAEVFGDANLVSVITVKKTSSSSGTLLSTVSDFLIWYAKDRARVKYRQAYLPKTPGGPGGTQYTWVEYDDGTRKNRRTAEGLLDQASSARVFRADNLTSQRPMEGADVKVFSFEGVDYTPGKGTFKTDRNGLENLRKAHRLIAIGRTLSYVRFLDDFPVFPISNLWDDTVISGFGDPKVYVVQTLSRVAERCLIMTTDPGDLVLDPTCGSGTTAYVAEQWGRRWITCDTSRVSIALAKQRSMTALYDYYQLAHPDEGVGSGFKYKTVPHVTLKSIANNPEIKEGMSREQIDAAIAKYAEQETLYDRPFVDKSRARVSGPFTVEAVPAPTVRSLAEVTSGAPDPSPERERRVVDTEGQHPALALGAPSADASVGRSGETLRQDEWRAELLKCGIRGKSGQRIGFSRVEPLAGTRWLHADAEARDEGTEGRRDEGKGSIAGARVVISFGPEHAPLEQRQVEQALEEAQLLKPKPKMVVFASFQFDPEAAKDIDETNWPGVTLLKVQMNTDLLTDDLKKKRSSNESFWMIGQPDVEVRRDAGTRGRRDEGGDRYVVEVRGFDYYNPREGKIESGDTSKIAMWMLDTDYDGRSLYPSQVFFPMAGPKDGWARLARNLRAEIDEELIEAYRGTVSLPFERGQHGRVAVKIVDDRGIESLRIVGLSR
jgi:adenine-specific DNA-methyltransferase